MVTKPTSKMVFITVGTTSFDELIRVVDTDAFLAVLKSRGYDRLLIQLGRGEYLPSRILQNTFGIQVDYYRYNPEYKNDIEASSLVISHAGSGSIMDSLSASKALLVVINTGLMDNHQAELAHALERKHHLIATTTKNLLSSLEQSDFSILKSYPSPNLDLFPRLLAQELGYI